ncbi:MAG: hypothetical protein ACW99A_22590 [Candidatus Kariarchaeaceae archaeon]|jgi:hypothetical protein
MNINLRQYLIDQYRILHQTLPEYGKTGDGHNLINVIEPVLKKNNIQSVLDYGCGKCTLVDTMYVKGFKYDPAIPYYNILSREAINNVEAIISVDVLEHIPDIMLGEDLQFMKGISDKQIHVINIQPSFHILPDGMPCHLNIKTLDQWKARLLQFLPEVFVLQEGRNRIILGSIR